MQQGGRQSAFGADASGNAFGAASTQKVMQQRAGGFGAAFGRSAPRAHAFGGLAAAIQSSSQPHKQASFGHATPSQTPYAFGAAAAPPQQPLQSAFGGALGQQPGNALGSLAAQQRASPPATGSGAAPQAASAPVSAFGAAVACRSAAPPPQRSAFGQGGAAAPTAFGAFGGALPRAANTLSLAAQAAQSLFGLSSPTPPAAASAPRAPRDAFGGAAMAADDAAPAEAAPTSACGGARAQQCSAEGRRRDAPGARPRAALAQTDAALPEESAPPTFIGHAHSSRPRGASRGKTIAFTAPAEAPGGGGDSELTGALAEAEESRRTRRARVDALVRCWQPRAHALTQAGPA